MESLLRLPSDVALWHPDELYGAWQGVSTIEVEEDIRAVWLKLNEYNAFGVGVNAEPLYKAFEDAVKLLEKNRSSAWHAMPFSQAWCVSRQLPLSLLPPRANLASWVPGDCRLAQTLKRVRACSRCPSTCHLRNCISLDSQIQVAATALALLHPC